MEKGFLAFDFCLVLFHGIKVVMERLISPMFMYAFKIWKIDLNASRLWQNF